MKEWRYLTTEPFMVRQAMAAWFVRKCHMVVEIGSYRTPIADFLPALQRCVCIDPLLTRQTTEGRAYIKQRIQDAKLPALKDYGLVVLGLQLLGDGAMERFIFLSDNSLVTVVEVATDFEPSAEQYRQLLERGKKKQVVAVGLDLSDNDFGDMLGSWHPRTKRALFVLREGK